MNSLTTISLIVLGFIPSLSWLLFYLRKDAHPEPKANIAKVFFLGMATAPFVIVFQMIPNVVLKLNLGLGSQSFIFWAALVEELFKFLVIWLFILNTQDFDEPIDAMIYMIVAALGFAAMENILFLFRALDGGFQNLIAVWGLRFVGATFLHALAGAVTGYFLGLAWFYHHHAYKIIALGLILATLFHFAFNIFVLNSNLAGGFFYSSFALLLTFSILIAFLFHKLWQRQLRQDYT
ncbi:MAG: hypothetical protein COV31_02945 [Candidatus Yanofskybacteria bacterium CG10_big_fil_rev_8_21_14_0_10_46_23]|uniref:Protease PrsW n=1 Tax=Candidatus Yanofskybacteria bacterium CG10_big_fil_rev_8_21_14_0_10_46_23 TaxID=1975098 RepID=A0A2H0R5I0_9BACT|nr:MAG: hypothetical protein COV31_02945 [Candidatus Yanofskybacteria bacterium CG10_big_fil_rev_8_21_14_0_10_46_23]